MIGSASLRYCPCGQDVLRALRSDGTAISATYRVDGYWLTQCPKCGRPWNDAVLLTEPPAQPITEPAPAAEPEITELELCNRIGCIEIHLEMAKRVYPRNTREARKALRRIGEIVAGM